LAVDDGWKEKFLMGIKLKNYHLLSISFSTFFSPLQFVDITQNFSFFHFSLSISLFLVRIGKIINQMIRPSYGYRSAHLVSLSLENPWAGAVVFWADVFAVVSPSTPHQINCRREKEKVPQNTKNKKKQN